MHFSLSEALIDPSQASWLILATRGKSPIESNLSGALFCSADATTLTQRLVHGTILLPKNYIAVYPIQP